MTEDGIKMAQAIEYERILRTHERKAKQEIIKQKTKEFVQEGVDKTIARIMAKAMFEAGL